VESEQSAVRPRAESFNFEVPSIEMNGHSSSLRPPSSSSSSVSIEGIKEAADRIRPFVHRTPLLRCSFLENSILGAAALVGGGGAAVNGSADEREGPGVFFKCENLQKVGAFKIRGACNAVSLLKQENPETAAVVTHSSGNHAQALALAARLHGLRALVVMPKDSPKVKVAAVEGYGGEITFCEPNQQAREDTADLLLKKHGGTFIHPYDDTRVVCGQGTVGLEIAQDLKGLDAVVIPVGGGGLLSGTAVAIKALTPTTRVIAAEPVNADDAKRSFEAGEKKLNEAPPQTVADGLKTNLGDVTWPLIRQTVDEVISVSESEILSALRLVMERMKLVIEPSAAVGVAACLRPEFAERGYKRVCVVLCGGNLELDRCALFFPPLKSV